MPPLCAAESTSVSRRRMQLTQRTSANAPSARARAGKARGAWWRVTSAIYGTAIVGALVTGCAGEGAALVAPSLSPLGVPEADALADQALKEYGEHLRDLYPDIVLPVIDRERFVSRSEVDQVQAECLTELGFPATPMIDGGVAFGYVPDEQARAQSVALYTCKARFPLDPTYTQPYSDEEVAYLYAYTKEVLLPCLRAEGFETPAMPSKTKFEESLAGSGAFDPLEFVVREASVEEFDRVVAACPSLPPDFRR